MRRRDYRWLAVGLCLVAFQYVRATEDKGHRLFSLSLELSGEATDNRDSTHDDKQSNVDLMATLRGDVRHDYRQGVLQAYYAPGYRWRSDPSDVQNESELHHQLGLILDHQFTERTKVNFWEYFDYTDDPSVTQGASTVRENGSYMMNRAQLTGSQQLTKTMYLDANVYSRIKRYDEQIQSDELDEDSTSVGLTLWRQISQNDALLGLVGYTTYDYSQEQPSRDLDSAFLGAGDHHLFANGLRANLRGGVTHAEYDDDSIESEDQPSVDIALMNPDTAITRITASAGYALRDADIAPFASQEHSFVRTDVDYHSTKRVTLSGSAAFHHSKYDKIPVGSAPGTEGGDEDLVELSAGASYQVNDNNKVMFRQIYQTVDSTVKVSLDRSYDRNASVLAWLIKL